MGHLFHDPSRGTHNTGAKACFRACLLVCVLVAPLGLSGCRLMGKGDQSEATAIELKNAPQMLTQSLNDRHMLVMRAPNPGWSLQLDRDHRGKDAWVISVTIRRPDPSFMYPQRMIDKRLLTNVESDQPIRVMARMLDHDEHGNDDEYAALTLVDAFEP